MGNTFYVKLTHPVKLTQDNKLYRPGYHKIYSLYPCLRRAIQDKSEIIIKKQEGSWSLVKDRYYSSSTDSIVAAIIQKEPDLYEDPRFVEFILHGNDYWPLIKGPIKKKWVIGQQCDSCISSVPDTEHHTYCCPDCGTEHFLDSQYSDYSLEQSNARLVYPGTNDCALEFDGISKCLDRDKNKVMTGTKAVLKIGGEPVAFAENVYYEFDKNKHIIDEIESYKYDKMNEKINPKKEMLVKFPGFRHEGREYESVYPDFNSDKHIISGSWKTNAVSYSTKKAGIDSIGPTFIIDTEGKSPWKDYGTISKEIKLEGSPLTLEHISEAMEKAKNDGGRVVINYDSYPSMPKNNVVAIEKLTGEDLDNAAALFGYSRRQYPSTKGGGFEMETDSELKKRILSDQGVHMQDNNFPFDTFDMFGSDEEEESAEFNHNDPTKESQLIPIKEVTKIKLDPDEALCVKLPEGTDAESAQQLYQYLCQVFNTSKIVVLVGDVEFTKVDWSKHKNHPLY